MSVGESPSLFGVRRERNEGRPGVESEGGSHEGEPVRSETKRW